MFVRGRAGPSWMSTRPGGFRATATMPASEQGVAVSALESLDGAKVLVTVASSGIGAALAPMLAARGATVGIAARRTERLAEVLAACRRASADAHRGGRDHRSWTVDLSDPGAAGRLATDAWDALGHLDAVVNNAGRPMRRPVQRLTVETGDEVMRTNYLSPVALSRAVLPRMLARDRGVLVNVGSLAGRVGPPSEAAYAASKFALEGWMESLAGEVEPFGIRTMIVEPGFFRTELLTPESTTFAELSIDDYDEARAESNAFWSSMNRSAGGNSTNASVRSKISRIMRCCSAA